jgi:hypothetical protein
VITTALSGAVSTERARVWRAITDPAERLRWDEPLLALLEHREGDGAVGETLRWRYRLGRVTIVLREQTLERLPEERLRSDVCMGLFRFERTWTLAADAGGTQRTRVGLGLVASNSIPVVGGVVDRFDVRRMAAEYVDTKLRSLRLWCQAGADTAAAGESADPVGRTPTLSS